MEAVLDYLQERHPLAVIDVMCSGPERVTMEYGLDAVQMFWFDQHQDRLSPKPWNTLRVPSRILISSGVAVGASARNGDRPRCRRSRSVPPAATVEHALWTVPPHRFGQAVQYQGCPGLRGGGSDQTAGDTNPFQLGSPIGRVSLLSRWRSREAMRNRGIESRDSVFPDLAFSLPTPEKDRLGGGDWSIIGVGVMAYVGSNDDRHRAPDIYRAYVEGMKGIVCRLVDDARKVRLFIGDTDGSDDATAREILAAVRELRPDLDETWVIAEPVTTLCEIMESMEPLGAVIATRFHNLIAALKLAKPTIAIGYSDKHRALMADAGLAEFTHPIESFDPGVVVGQLREMESHAETIDCPCVRTTRSWPTSRTPVRRA